jgi:hypothetical protein
MSTTNERSTEASVTVTKIGAGVEEKSSFEVDRRHESKGETEPSKETSSGATAALATLFDRNAPLTAVPGIGKRSAERIVESLGSHLTRYLRAL